MSEQNANMILPDAPEKIFSGEVNDVNVSQKGHDTQGTNEKGVDETIKSETEAKTETVVTVREQKSEPVQKEKKLEENKK